MICALGASPSPDTLTVVDDGHVALYGLEPYLTNRIQLDGIDAAPPTPRRMDRTVPLRVPPPPRPTSRRPGRARAVHRRHRRPRRRRPPAHASHALPADGTRPIAVITTEPAIARTVIHVNEHGLATFDGQTIRCHRLTPAVADTARQLIEHADSAPAAEARQRAHTGRSASSSPRLFPPDPTTPGPCACSDRCGSSHRRHGDLPGGRARQLLTLLALHPNGLSGEDIYDALVPDKVADPDSKRSYVKARMTELRKAPRRRRHDRRAQPPPADLHRRHRPLPRRRRRRRRGTVPPTRPTPQPRARRPHRRDGAHRRSRRPRRDLVVPVGHPHRPRPPRPRSSTPDNASPSPPSPPANPPSPTGPPPRPASPSPSTSPSSRSPSRPAASSATASEYVDSATRSSTPTTVISPADVKAAFDEALAAG